MEKLKQIVGWSAVTITLLVSSLWAYWGTIENFHEGWYSTSAWENIGMFLFQYLLFPIFFVVLALVILRWQKIGLLLHIAAGIFCLWFFSGANFVVLGLLIIIPLVVLGLMYYWGKPHPRKLAYGLIIAIPLSIVLVISTVEGVKVSQRIDDGNYGARVIEGNRVTLVWAPRGEGWPDEGVSWEEASEICKYLSEDGTTIMQEEQNIWRLPTIDEAVRSMMLHGENAGGVWDADEQKAIYDKTPDKESPMWAVHSKVIYYWTADISGDDDTRACIVVYHGGIYDRRKTDAQDYLSFRAVKEIPAG
jgi:hypothetical protein